MSTNRRVALAVASKTQFTPTERRDLLDALGLLTPDGRITPDLTPEQQRVNVALTAAHGVACNPSVETQRRRGAPPESPRRAAQYSTPPGLRNLQPLPDDPPPQAKPAKKKKTTSSAPREPGAARPGARRTNLLPPTTDDKCGSRSGRRAHGKRGEHMCDPCRQVNNTAAAEYRAQRAARGAPKPKRPRPPCGSPYGARAHRWRGEPVCDPCRVADLAERRRLWQLRQAEKVAAGTSTSRRPRPACGSPGGKRAHTRRGEPVCQPCADAARAESRRAEAASQARKKATQT